jgi:signal transduction histidine kinase
MAHEINNPANFVSAGAYNAENQIKKLKSFIADLMSEDADAEIQKEFDRQFEKITDSLGVIKTGVSRIDNIVKHLRATHPEGDVGMQPADVVDTLESAWLVLTPTIKTPVAISTDFQARPLIPCLVAEVHQVFLALLTNAVHAIDDAVSSKGLGYQGEIRLDSRQQAGSLVISVSDNGIGISTGQLEKIFDPFFTTKVVGRGAGLGLSMARDVVKKHGGSLGAVSTPGEGSTFTVTLPLLNAAG